MGHLNHIPTIQELIELAVLEAVEISPDGRLAAYECSQPDWEENRYVSQIWLVDTDGESPPRQMTFAPNGSRQPRWSPDGRFLAFVSKRESDQVSQIYRLPAAGGEAERLSQAKTAVKQYLWAPDGESLAFTAEDPKTEADKVREKTFGKFQVEDEDFQFSHLWQLRLADKKLRKLTSGRQFTVSAFRWSPDGRSIIFAAPPNPDMGVAHQVRLYQVEVASLVFTPLTPPGYTSPRFSPDGRFLFCLQMPQYYYQPENPCLINLETGVIQPIETDFEENIHPQAWLPSGLAFSAVNQTAIHLYLLDPDTGQVRQLSPDLAEGWVSLAASFSQDGRLAALIMDNACQVNEVVVLSLESGEWRCLTNLTDAVTGWQLDQPEPYRWPSTDGTVIEGILTRPANFDPQKKYPLLVAIHGGPSWAALRQKLSHFERRLYPLPLWAARGAFILQPNYRGSVGYGATFQALNVRNLGLGDYEDVISGVDALIDAGWVDGDRVGVMGWSQGGYISMFITTYSDRFAAVSAGAGIASWMTYYVNTDVHPFTRHYLQGAPWEDPEIYAKTSPMTYIQQAQTPTLIQHGRDDFRVPLPNAYELYQGLRDMDVPVRLVTYPGMPHGPRLPRQSRQIMQDNLNWFNRWIWGEEKKEENKRPCYIACGSPAQAEELSHWARRDSADCRILSAADGLVEPAGYQHASTDFSAGQFDRLAAKVAAQLAALPCKSLVFYSAPIEKRPFAQIALGCLHVAAALAGGLKIAHEEVEEWGAAET